MKKSTVGTSERILLNPYKILCLMIKNYRLNNKYKIINIFAKTNKTVNIHLQNTDRKIKLKTVQNVLFNLIHFS